METIDTQDAVSISGQTPETSVFGKAPQPWQLLNGWSKPKRKRRKLALAEIDLWQEEN